MLSTDYHATAPSSAPAETSLVARLAEFFRSRPCQWVDGKTLSTIAGGYAWRTRVSDLRRAPFLMTIENRQRRIESRAGKFVTISEYSFVPSSGGAK